MSAASARTLVAVATLACASDCGTTCPSCIGGYCPGACIVDHCCDIGCESLCGSTLSGLPCNEPGLRCDCSSNGTTILTITCGNDYRTSCRDDPDNQRNCGTADFADSIDLNAPPPDLSEAQIVDGGAPD